jgi:hypothetical protein
MNLRIAIPLTMMVSFTLTCGFTLWNRRIHDQAPATPVNRRLEPVNAGLSPAVPRSNAPMAQPLSRSPQANAETDRNVAQAAPAAYAKLNLPIELNYRRSPVNPETYVVSVFNKTEEALALDITVFNPAGERASKTQLSIDADQSKKIGLDDGLEIVSGDRITLRNPSYSERVEEIRPR